MDEAQKAAAAQPKPPSPEQIKAQADAQKQQSDAQAQQAARQVRRLYVAVIERGVLHDVKVFEPVL
jgi:hypothetical protein